VTALIYSLTVGCVMTLLVATTLITQQNDDAKGQGNYGAQVVVSPSGNSSENHILTEVITPILMDDPNVKDWLYATYDNGYDID
jgi:hypothetical protein